SVKDAEGAKGRRIHARRDIHVMIALVTREGSPSERTHFAVDGIGVITKLLQFGLNAGDDLFRREVAINWFVVLIIRVGIVTPGRIPPAIVPAPPAPVEKDERRAMIFPPIVVVMM